MVVQIPCTRLTKRILTKEYGEQPIRISRSHELWPFLRPHVSGDRIGKSHVVARRSATFAVDVSRQVGEQLLRHASDAGTALHRFHFDMMMRYTITKGRPYRAALRQFQDKYHITDDDYDLDSAYRQWSRFLKETKEKSKKFGKNTYENVLPDSQAGSQQPPKKSDLDKLVQFVVRRLRYLRSDLPSYIFHQTAIYLYMEYGQVHYKEVMAAFGKKRNTVYHARQQIQGYIDVDPEFARLVHPMLLFGGQSMPAD